MSNLTNSNPNIVEKEVLGETVAWDKQLDLPMQPFGRLEPKAPTGSATDSTAAKPPLTLETQAMAEDNPVGA